MVSTAIAEVGNLVAMRFAASALLVPASASASASCEVVGSCPTTSTVTAESGTALISPRVIPGVESYSLSLNLTSWLCIPV
ncbi:Uncharacterised protein [Mycobacteroides abscessus]|nr:Uncharacterised protein [Mycobacteroides abscessus]